MRANADELSKHVAHLIVGSTLYQARPFLAEIISGAVDADKLDYMARDCYMAGLPMPVDVERLLQKMLAVGVPANSEPAAEYFRQFGILPHQTVYLFAVDLAGGKTVEEMVISRVLLYDKLYHHQKVRAFEGMIENALDVLMRESAEFSKPSTYLGLSDNDFLGGHWLHQPDSERVRSARVLLEDVNNRVGLVRAFAFGPSLLLPPLGQEDPAVAGRALRQLWRRVKPLVLRGRSPEAQAFKQSVVDRARSYFRIDGQPNLAESLEFTDVIIDLPDVQGIAEKTKFWFGNEDAGLQLYSDVARVERWAEVYENQKSVGYVYCRPEHAYAVHLAVRDEIADRVGARFEDRELTLTKLSFDTLNHLVARLNERGTVIPPVMLPARWNTPARVADRTQIEEAYNRRLERLADRFSSFQPAEGSRIDINLITDWLLQFPRDDIRFAVTLLENIQYWSRQGLADAFRAATDQLFGDYSGLVQLVSLGGPTTSAEHLQYLWADVRGMNPPADLRVLNLTEVRPEYPVVFFDDYIGSGFQSSTVIQQWSSVPRANWFVDEHHVDPVDERTLSTIKRCQTYFLFAAGRRTGIKHLEKTVRELWNPSKVEGLVVAPSPDNS